VSLPAVPPRHEAGVSLLEVLAALAILALVAGTVVVMMRPDDDPAQTAGETLLQAMAEARQEALVTGGYVGFAARADGRGYAFYRFADEGWSIRMDHPAFEAQRFRTTDLFLTVLEGAVPLREDAAGLMTGPQVWFDPTGVDQPFLYELRGSDGVRWLRRDGQGALTLIEPARPGTGA